MIMECQGYHILGRDLALVLMSDSDIKCNQPVNHRSKLACSPQGSFDQHDSQGLLEIHQGTVV